MRGIRRTQQAPDHGHDAGPGEDGGGYPGRAGRERDHRRPSTHLPRTGSPQPNPVTKIRIATHIHTTAMQEKTKTDKTALAGAWIIVLTEIGAAASVVVMILAAVGN